MQLIPKEVGLLNPGTCATLNKLRDWINWFWQIDKLVISQLGLLAQRRLARGVRLNHAEATVCTTHSSSDCTI